MHPLALNVSPAQKRGKISFLVIFSTWWSFWLILHLVILQDLGIQPLKALVDASISNCLLAAFCLLVINNMSYYLPRKEKYLYVLVLCIVLSAVWLFLSRFFLKSLYGEDPAYMNILLQSSGIRYAFAFLMIGCLTMLSLLWYNQQEQKDEQQRRSDTERLVREAELNKLRQQLQPHFLFNSLNSISALTGSQPEKARLMIQQLSDFLRGSIKKEEQQWSGFGEEIQYLQLYLEIEKVRFGYRLQTRIEYDEAVSNMKLPPMILQPIVENAIKFGLYDTTGEVTIGISAKNINGMLEISIQNPYDPSTSQYSKGTGFGLESVKRRLFLLFARHDLLEIRTGEQQFITVITIPQIA